MNEKDYHAHHALSHSQIEDFLKSPGLYYGRHVTGEIPPFVDTEATEVGTAMHAVALEGREAFERKVAIWRGGFMAPKKKGAEPEFTKNRNSNVYKAWKAEHPGMTELDEDGDNLVAEMLDALRSHNDACDLLWGLEGESEKSLFWRDVLDVEARCRLDRVLPSVDVIVDIKTARDVTPKGRAKCIAERGYDRKAEWYRRGYVANYGRPLREFFLIWVCTAETATKYDRVVVSRIGAISESLASLELDRAVASIVKRRESGDWRPDYCIDVQTDERAPWAIDRDLLQEAASQ
jgi:hypothetical protein